MLTDYISLLASPPAPKNEEDEYANTNQANEKQNHNVGNKDMYYLKEMNEDLLQVLWGKLACEILIEDYKAASIAVDATRTAMELLVANKELSSLKAIGLSSSIGKWVVWSILWTCALVTDTSKPLQRMLLTCCGT
jgi:hypothetical protein